MRVLRRVFGPKRDEVTGQWRELHSGKFHNLYSSPDIIRHIQSKRMRSMEHVVRIGEGRNVYRILVGKPEGKNHLKDQGVDGTKMDLKEIGWGGSGFTWLRIWTIGGVS
jgi:hypothetical protein